MAKCKIYNNKKYKFIFLDVATDTWHLANRAKNNWKLNKYNFSWVEKTDGFDRYKLGWIFQEYGEMYYTEYEAKKRLIPYFMNEIRGFKRKIKQFEKLFQKELDNDPFISYDYDLEIKSYKNLIKKHEKYIKEFTERIKQIETSPNLLLELLSK